MSRVPSATGSLAASPAQCEPANYWPRSNSSNTPSHPHALLHGLIDHTYHEPYTPAGSGSHAENGPLRCRARQGVPMTCPLPRTRHDSTLLSTSLCHLRALAWSDSQRTLRRSTWKGGTREQVSQRFDLAGSTRSDQQMGVSPVNLYFTNITDAG
jgi:hypothetical protein